MPSPGEVVRAAYEGVAAPYVATSAQVARMPTQTTLQRSREPVTVYDPGIRPASGIIPQANVEPPPVPAIDEGLNVEDIGLGLGAGAFPLGIAAAGLAAPAALVPAAAAGALVPTIAAALPAVAAGAAGLAAGGLGALALGGISAMFDGVDAGANMGLFGVDWGDIFGLGQGDIAELTGQRVVQSWNTGTAKFYRTQDGKIHTFTKTGVLKSWRPARHIVVSKNPRMGTLLKASRRIDRLWKGINKKAGSFIKTKKVSYGQLPATMLSKVERAAIKS